MATADNPAAEEALFTIDDLAREVGMTVRNLREWRTLGLLPRAEMRGRVGFYDAAVVERVHRIKDLHAQGFTLDLIRRMMETGGDSADEVMRFAEALRAPFRTAGPSPEEIAATLNAIGMSEAEAEAVTAQVREHADRIAELFEAVWMKHVWQPFVDAGMPEDQIQQLQETVGRVQPLAAETVEVVFSAAMEARIAQGIARELEAALQRR